MTENVQKDCDRKAVNVINERVRMVIDRKDVKLILTERIRMDLDHDKKGKIELWPKACKWVMIENVQMGYDRKGANGRVWKIANGRDWKVANGSWPKGCEWIVTKKMQTSHGKRVQMVVTERLQMGCDKKVQTCHDQKE